ncbi:dihydrofolate reductase family protein [Agrococcus sp. Marseille-P2731]|uniref:dihydrofolate reductase family protein n=1 Tax=Agrococcus sp. Marseille-P2731 TaxID=1841862 RepID=UPI0009317FD2|nr:dihydrofolate reductase family protein [Agrococcus sp. Marseille-P2731]
MPRTVVFNMTVSMDGRITGPAGEGDMEWVVPHVLEDVVRDQLDGAIRSATTALMGSGNAEGFAIVWPPVADDERADARDRAFARWLDETEKVVFSSTGTSTWRDARVVSGDAAAIVRDLLAEAGGDILVLNSVSLMQALLEADLIDRIDLVVVPEILGGGRMLFEQPLPASSWSLEELGRGETGVLALRFRRRR